LGVFIGLSPLWGFQTVVVLFLAFILRLNKLIAFAFSNISLPPLIPFIIYASLKIGNFILENKELPDFEWDTFKSYKDFIGQHLSEYILGSFALAVICSVLFGIASYLLLGIRMKRLSN